MCLTGENVCLEERRGVSVLLHKLEAELQAGVSNRLELAGPSPWVTVLIVPILPSLSWKRGPVAPPHSADPVDFGQ